MNALIGMSVQNLSIRTRQVMGLVGVTVTLLTFFATDYMLYWTAFALLYSPFLISVGLYLLLAKHHGYSLGIFAKSKA